ncbi:MAG TPA: DUF3857 domain-containing protein [Albitalea sp.]|nr:DUF3857 domain-containing protein [Albitalea sp.]
MGRCLRLMGRVALCLAWIVPAHAAAREFSVGPPPPWVERIAPQEQAAVPTGQVSRGVYYLLSDLQTRVEGAQKLQYRHFAMKALNESGVTSVANVEISFDPAYQSLTVHEINVRRDGRLIAKLDAAAIRVLQREKELEYQIFDGSKTANAFLDDVRVGDIVEYAYTLRGSNPVFGGRLFGGIDLQWSAPVHSLVGRLLWPAGRPIYLANHKTDLQPTLRERGAEREYRWEAQDVAALVIEDNAPSWYDPYPYVQWSEFKDWQAVAQWAQPLYRTPPQLGAALKAEVDRIAAASTEPSDRLVATLRFVQAQIRYLGVEIGASSHAPSTPQAVLQRRFGDCKDKALLTVTMLRALGIAADPALVNTKAERGIADVHPTPGAFNHVIVRARVAGSDYWIDPTLPPQKGSLEHLVQSNYGMALVVNDATRGLTPMPRAAASAFKRSVHTVFDARAGVNEPVRFTVTSVLEGASAESMRSTLASRNREELQKDYLNFYAAYFDGVTQDAALSVTDDERANRLTLTEQYLIASFWKRSEKKKRVEAEVYVPDVDDALHAPRERVRSAPLGLRHPVDLTHTAEVLLPDSWDIKPNRTAVADPAFDFERRSELRGRTLVLTDSFRSRADHVAPADTPRYVANLQRARDAIGYSIYSPDPSEPKAAAAPPATGANLNWPVAMVAVLLLLGFTALAAKLYRYDPPPAAGVPDPALRGIAGWLLLPALGVLLSPLRLAGTIAQVLPSYGAAHWANLTTVGSASYHPLWAPLLLFELAINLGLIVFSLLLLVLFFQKRRSVPRVFIGFVAAVFVAEALDLAASASVPAVGGPDAKDWDELVRSGLSLAIWGSYFSVSRRVKATFVHGRREPTPPLNRSEPAMSD